MKYSRAIVLLPAFYLVACAIASPPPSLPTPNPAEQIPPAEAKESPEAGSWKIIPTNQPQSYLSLITTVITQQEEPTSRRDSSTIQAHFSITTTRVLDTLFVTGSLSQFDITGDIVQAERPNIPTPISFTAKLSSHNLITQISGDDHTANPLTCENAANTPLKALQRNFLFLPLQLRTGQTWTDSISSVSCNGTLAVTSTVIRTFTVSTLTEIQGNSAILIDQNERTLSEGEGSQGQHRMLIKGEGSGSGRVYVDSNSGALLASNSTTKTIFSIQSSGRIQHFIQNTTQSTQKSH